MSEDMNHNNQQPVQPSTPGEQPLPANQQPVQPPAPSGVPVDSQAPQTPLTQDAPQEQPEDESNKPLMNRSFRENGKFSFWAVDEDPDTDSKPMSWGFKIGWFMLGFVGGMLGLVMAWLSTATLSKKRRSQAVMATWLGFAAQAILFLIIVLSGGSFPFMPGGGATTTATTTTTAPSAFG